MKAFVLVGAGEALEQACLTARECGLDFTRLELPSVDRYNFDLSVFFEKYSPAETEVFVALDARAINYSRHKLIADIRLAGCRLLNIVSPKAIVDEGVRLLGGVYIGPGCNVAAGSNIGLGCWLERQVVIESGVRLGACVTLRAGVQLGRNVGIGKGSTLGSGSIALENTKVGRHCEWLLPGSMPSMLPDCSFYDQLMPAGARIV